MTLLARFATTGLAAVLLCLVLGGCSGSGSDSQDGQTTSPSPLTSATGDSSTPATVTATKAAVGGGAKALFATGYKPCKTVDKNALGHAAGMTLIKSIPTADNGCLWGTGKLGVGVQVSIHKNWPAGYIGAIKAAQSHGSTATDVSVQGASAAVVVRAKIGKSELDNAYVIFPQGGVEVALTGPPATATVARAVAAADVIVG